MFRLVGFAAVATAIYVSCYQPSFRDCEISCTAESGCPSGLTCDTGVGRCAAHGTCAPNDATDGNSLDVSSACWSFTPTNYAPCEPGFPIATAELAGTVIDTDSTNCTYGSANVCLYHYTKISIVTPLAVTGTRPLILVADGDIDVMSTVSYDGVGKSSSSCNAQMAVASPALGAGGGGGGYGSNGGAGGAGSSPATLGGDSFGSSSLEPLVLGCPGAKGGAAGTALAVNGGMGGGAIELSSNAMVTIASGGVVSADGGGGAGGLGVGSTNLSGGGGGGAGGSILIEGNMVAVAGMLCAVGGGGGEGGFGSGMAQAVGGGGGMGCTPGAGGSSGIGAGGRGGGLAKAVSGTAAGTVIAGGGGGGGVGRIRIHSISTADTTGSTSVPAAVEQ